MIHLVIVRLCIETGPISLKIQLFEIFKVLYKRRGIFNYSFDPSIIIE